MHIYTVALIQLKKRSCLNK